MRQFLEEWLEDQKTEKIKVQRVKANEKSYIVFKNDGECSEAFQSVRKKLKKLFENSPRPIKIFETVGDFVERHKDR